jgi:hypothetical protein
MAVVPFSMALRITRTGLHLPAPSELANLRATFERQHAVVLPGLLEPYLVEWLRERAARGPWETIVHSDLDPPAVDLLLRDDVAWGTIATLLNDRALFAAITALTGVDGIAANFSRIYRMDPDAGHTDTWHGDNDGNRLLTLSINIGAARFEGGELELRDKSSGALLFQWANTGPGDGLLFRIADDLQHRVRDVAGTQPKYAVAGWFQRTSGV